VAVVAGVRRRGEPSSPPANSATPRELAHCAAQRSGGNPDQPADRDRGGKPEMNG
jgi:hypothetical protein